MNDKTHRVRLLPNGLEIREDLVQGLIQQVGIVVPNRAYDIDYRINRLVTREFWAPLPKADHYRLGRCLVYLEQQGLVPLTYVGCPRCSVKFYRRK